MSQTHRDNGRTFQFPIHVSENGSVTHPNPDEPGINPYTLPWVQGAAETLPLRTRNRYPAGMTDLREKLTVLKTKRPLKLATEEIVPAYGPRRHSPQYRALHNRPLPEDGPGGSPNDGRN